MGKQASTYPNQQKNKITDGLGILPTNMETNLVFVIWLFKFTVTRATKINLQSEGHFSKYHLCHKRVFTSLLFCWRACRQA